MFGPAVTAVSPLAAAADIRVLAFSNDASVATEGTFLLGFRPEEQVDRVVRYAIPSGSLVRAVPAPPARPPAAGSGGPRRRWINPLAAGRLEQPPVDLRAAAHRRAGAG